MATSTRTLRAASATAIAAMGLMTGPATAHAAPACSAYQFIGDFALQQSNGFRVEFRSTGQNASGTATATPLSGGAAMHGPVSGGVSGRNVHFSITWSGTSVGIYDGIVGDDDFAHGNTYDQGNKQSKANWDSTVPLGCLAAPAPPPPQQQPTPTPSQQPTPAPQQPAAKLATVTNDVDVYPKPNINDDQIAQGILRGGSQVELVGACKAQDWCQVKGGAVPGNQGFIWGNLQLP